MFVYLKYQRTVSSFKEAPIRRIVQPRFVGVPSKNINDLTRLSDIL